MKSEEHPTSKKYTKSVFLYPEVQSELKIRESRGKLHEVRS